MIALSPEPADPTERWENGLAQQSYADAVMGDNGDSDDGIDETAIKETPPRIGHLRNVSARSLDEVMDQSAPASPSSRTHSPTLRHPKGRLEEKGSRESYAEAMKEVEGQERA